MARGVPDDRPDCLVCGLALPSRHERASRRGRPRRYCSNRCKERARSFVLMEQRAAYWGVNGDPDRAARVRARIAISRWLWRAA